MNNVPKRITPTNSFIPFRDEEVEQSVPERFAQIVRRYPDRVAVGSGSQSFTYRDLDKASDQVAQAVFGMGGTGAEPVALLLDHGPMPIIAMLGILKAGKCYVALDATSTRSRLEYILNETQTRTIVTNQRRYSLAAELSPHGCQLLNIDDLEPYNSSQKLDISISPDALAAIYYTSGSTGQPKGVINAHRNMLHSAKLKTNDCHICSDDRVALLFSYSVAWSKALIFAPLFSGGAILPFDIGSEGLKRLSRWLIREEVTIFTTVTTLFRNFIETLTGDEKFSKLRLVSIGGETVHRQDAELYRKHFSQNCLLHIGMGITEACSPMTSIFLDKSTEINGDVVPIGYPLENTEILLFDEDGEEVEHDHIGEIAVKSRYLTPGYWRKPELTAQSFQSCPGEEPVRIYRTGDQGRMASDGCLYHLGRKDFQVKVRGHRVETAEVERALLNIGIISQAAVVTHPDAQSENRLVAYIVCNQTPKPTVTQLRLLLNETLPAYMMPSNFVFVDVLPMTISGKVDFQELSIPDVSRPELDSPFVPPRSSIERRLIEIWSEILNVSPIGVCDDFFDLGGHSISAMRLFTLIEKRFGKKLPVSILFEAPTIEMLSAVLDKEHESGRWSSLVPIQRGGSKPPFFCVHNLSGDVLSYGELARNLGPDQPFYGLRAQGLDGKQKPYTKIEAMASHYIREMRAVQPEGPYLLGGMCFGGVVAFEMAQQLHALGQEVGQLFLLDTSCPPFNLKQRLNFIFERYTRIFREGILDALSRSSPTSCTSKQHGFLKRHRSISDIFQILRVDRANNRALRKYRPQCYSGRLVHFLVSQPLVSVSPDSRKKWETYARGGLEVHTIPGDHHTVLREPHVHLLAKKLKEYLNTEPSG
ncbi:MAG: AMP-binding protein [Gemmatimonadota bacterium]|nr:MAG: AMP-binding protein [Gemmatimonadota bacterium]